MRRVKCIEDDARNFIQIISKSRYSSKLIKDIKK